ncbi:MAG: recombinase family protein [Candidatus Eisenbacteria bacterium]|nr:recombinase family protein [Candidatus Eisenbacteria bacterium]
MKAAIYLRVSTEEQRERQSIATQREFAERYCSLHEISITDAYSDDGVSGTIPLEQRPEGSRLLQDARSKCFDAVLVYKLDRLGRDPRMLLNAFNDLEVLGIQLLSMTEAFDTDSPAGRFMRTILSGVAGLERDNIVQRSIEGTNRLARQGAWLGGIVPYGYRVEGKHKDARLVISEDPLPGLPLSEAGVIRLIYKMSAEDGKSCIAIAGHLNRLRVPPAYVRDSRLVLRGKRKQTTSGIWRPSRVRNLIVNSTYKGLHEYGKRSKKARDIIRRSVPALVSEETWKQAQQTLKRNYIFSTRNARRKYLLRGLMKCGLCGLTYVGTAYPSAGGTKRVYYVCIGKQSGRGTYGLQGRKCPSKAIAGNIEDLVWRDVEGFLRNPGAVLKQLADQIEGTVGESASMKIDADQMKQALRDKDNERDRVLGLYRRGRIDEPTLDRQLDEIAVEREALIDEINRLDRATESAMTTEARLRSTADLLRELNHRLDQPLTWELKRQIVEVLVEAVRVDTIEEDGKRDTRATVTYRFCTPEVSIEDRTGGRAKLEVPPGRLGELSLHHKADGGKENEDQDPEGDRHPSRKGKIAPPGHRVPACAASEPPSSRWTSRKQMRETPPGPTSIPRTADLQACASELW